MMRRAGWKASPGYEMLRQPGGSSAFGTTRSFSTPAGMCRTPYDLAETLPWNAAVN